MIERCETIAALASELKVRLMIDAEQTYFQRAIDNVVYNLQRKYNVDFPTIFTTFQCYLTSSYKNVELNLELAKRNGYFFAAKIVRGAYMISERARASDMGYADPIQPTIEATHDNYNKVMELIVQNLAAGHRVNLMVASHNQRSMELMLELMNKYHIHHSNGGIYFGQLLGMADHLTFSLGGQGYKVYKYLPYGPVDEVVPYLLRRVQENSDIMSGAYSELQKLSSELQRRAFKR